MHYCKLDRMVTNCGDCPRCGILGAMPLLSGYILSLHGNLRRSTEAVCLDLAQDTHHVLEATLPSCSRLSSICRDAHFDIPHATWARYVEDTVLTGSNGHEVVPGRESSLGTPTDHCSMQGSQPPHLCEVNPCCLHPPGCAGVSR